MESIDMGSKVGMGVSEDLAIWVVLDEKEKIGFCNSDCILIAILRIVLITSDKMVEDKLVELGEIRVELTIPEFIIF